MCATTGLLVNTLRRRLVPLTRKIARASIPRQHLEETSRARCRPMPMPDSIICMGNGAIYEVACGARTAQVPRHPCHPRFSHHDRGADAYRHPLSHRRRSARQAKPVATRSSADPGQATAEEARILDGKVFAFPSPPRANGGAIRYALSRWCALTRYIDDGLLEIDNSAAERALRAVALAVKNYLFAGFRCRWRSGSHVLQPHRLSQAQRP